MFRTLTFPPARPWRTHPRETLAAVLLGAAVLALANAGDAMPLLPRFATQAEPDVPLNKPLPTDIRKLAPETALQVNARIPLASGPNPAALPFTLANASH